MKKIICMLLFIQSGFMMAQTETIVTPNGKKVTFYPGAPGTADNGLTITSGNIQLGGALTKPSILTTTSAYTLAILGLQTGTSTDDLVVTDANGVLRKIAPSNLITKYDLSSTTPNTVLEVNGLGATLAAASVNIKPSATVGEVLTTTAAGVVGWKKPAVDAGDITTKADLTSSTPSVLTVSGTGATLINATVGIKPSEVQGYVMTTTSEGNVAWEKPTVNADDIGGIGEIITLNPEILSVEGGDQSTLKHVEVGLIPSNIPGYVMTTEEDGVIRWSPPTMDARNVTAKANLTTTTSVLDVDGMESTLRAATINIRPSKTVGEVITTTPEGMVEWMKPAVDAGDITGKANLTTNTPNTVLDVRGLGATLAAASVNIKPSVNVGEVLTTTAAGVVGWKAATASNLMEIKKISSDYTVSDADYTIIASKLTGDITITLPDATANKGRILVINQFNTLLADGKTPATVKFNTNVIYSDSVSVAYIAGSIFEGATAGSAKVTLQSDGTDWYVITYNM